MTATPRESPPPPPAARSTHPLTVVISAWLLLAIVLFMAAISSTDAATSGAYEKLFAPSSQRWLILALAHVTAVYAFAFWWTLRRFRRGSAGWLGKAICILTWMLSPIMFILACGLVFETQAYLAHRAF